MRDNPLDRGLKSLFLSAIWRKKNETIEDAIYEHLLGRQAEKVSKIYYEIFSVIDGKASTLLTHVSMMIAANAVLLAIESSKLLNLASTLLLVLFVIVALLTLRLLRFWADGFRDLDKSKVIAEIEECESNKSELRGTNIEKMQRLYNEEVWYRNKLYNLCLNMATIFTLLSLVLFGMYGQELIEQPRKQLDGAVTPGVEGS